MWSQDFVDKVYCNSCLEYRNYMKDFLPSEIKAIFFTGHIINRNIDSIYREYIP